MHIIDSQVNEYILPQYFHISPLTHPTRLPTSPFQQSIMLKTTCTLLLVLCVTGEVPPPSSNEPFEYSSFSDTFSDVVESYKARAVHAVSDDVAKYMDSIGVTAVVHDVSSLRVKRGRRARREKASVPTLLMSHTRMLPCTAFTSLQKQRSKVRHKLNSHPNQSLTSHPKLYPNTELKLS